MAGQKKNEQSSTCYKIRKAYHLRASNPAEKLSFAARIKSREVRKTGLSFLLKQATEISTRKSKVSRKLVKSFQSHFIKQTSMTKTRGHTIVVR